MEQRGFRQRLEKEGRCRFSPRRAKLIPMASKLKILVSNDDGINAAGIKTLVKELSRMAEITVVAPDGERSAIGTAVTLRRPLKVQPAEVNIDGVKAWATDGTPADSVILGLEKICPDADIVVCGINAGHNLGDDVLISGTVGAALQGYLRRRPTLAVSVADEGCFAAAANLAARLAKRIGDGVIPRNVFLNVNYPSLPPGKVGAVEITRLASETHLDSVAEAPGGEERHYHLTRDRLDDDAPPGTDIHAIERGHISVSPLHTLILGRTGPGLTEAHLRGTLGELRGGL